MSRRPLPVDVLAAGEDDLGAHVTGGAGRSVRTVRVPATLDEWATHVGDEPAGGLAAPVLEVHLDGVTGPVVREPLTAEQFAQLVDEGRALRLQFDTDSAPMRQLTAEDRARRCQ